MRRPVRLVVIAAGAAVIALVVGLSHPSSTWTALVGIGGAVAMGELVTLRPLHRAELPMSFAFIVVLAERAPLGNGTLVLLVALLASFLVRSEPATVEGRLLLLGERLAEGGAALLTFHLVVDPSARSVGRVALIAALTASACAPLVVSEIVNVLRRRGLGSSVEGRSADVALVTSAVLMGISDLGIDGRGGMGLWGPAIFTIPLLAAWYSYEHLATIQRTYDQTIRALGAAPELGGLVIEGHSARVAALAVDLGVELGFSRDELTNLETAALLHHLGQVCLDEPDDGRPAEPNAVARAGAQILRGTSLLAPAGDIIATEPLPAPDRVAARPSTMAGQALKVASAFDEISEGHPEHAGLALEMLTSSPAYVYDARVLRALEQVLERRGLLGVMP